MSTILEQYFAAARQRREHDSARVSTAEYINTRNPEHWVCCCGNTPQAQGFFPLDENERARMAASEPCGAYILKLDLWECDRCKRVIVAPHGYVTRGPMADYEGVSRTPAPEDAPCLLCGAPESGCECEPREDVEKDSNRTLGLRNGD